MSKKRKAKKTTKKTIKKTTEETRVGLDFPVLGGLFGKSLAWVTVTVVGAVIFTFVNFKTKEFLNLREPAPTTLQRHTSARLSASCYAPVAAYGGCGAGPAGASTRAGRGGLQAAADT